MLWVKALHIVFMVTWFAGLFYLPRLFVYHAMTSDEVSLRRFETMERRLYRGIMAPAAVLTIASGLWLWLGFGLAGGWLYAKLVVVAALVAYHLACGRIVRTFREGRNRRSHRWYRVYNELPALALLVAVVLAVVKPF